MHFANTQSVNYLLNIYIYIYINVCMCQFFIQKVSTVQEIYRTIS